MKTNQIIIKVLVLIAVLAMLFASIQAQAEIDTKKITIKGLIVSRNGDSVTVRSKIGNVTVTLNGSTEINVVKGVFGFRSEHMRMAALIPGVRVQVEALSSGNQTVAKSIKFKSDDLKTTYEIQAGLAMTQQQAQANQKKLKAQKQQIEANQNVIKQAKAEDAILSKRFSELNDYDVKGEATVLFAVNGAKLSEKAKEDLKTLSARAKNLEGYLIQVAGYTDSSGRADFNQELSDHRAESVTAYLLESCDVPIFRVLAPTAMGMSKPAANNETAQGKAENRCAVVKILVNRNLSQ